jgi:hypothetical protein
VRRLFVGEGRLAPGVAQVPFDVEGEHAEEHVRADAVFEPVVDPADLQLGPLEDAEVALDLFELLVGAHDVGRVKALGGDAGAQNIDAVQRGLCAIRSVLRT